MRHRRQTKPKRIADWPDDAPPPAEVALAATYVGSPEHKTAPTAAGAPRLRHNDASRCDPRYTDFQQITDVLREGIRVGCTSEFVGRFPKYVWGVLDGTLYEARLVNHDQGTYKGYQLSARAELPTDPNGQLNRLPEWNL